MGKMMANVLPNLIHIWVTSVREDCGSSSSSGGRGGPMLELTELTGLSGGEIGPLALTPGPPEPSILFLISKLQ